MSVARKITDAEWERYESDIKTFYVTQKLTREQVMEYMEEKYNFRARFAYQFSVSRPV